MSSRFAFGYFLTGKSGLAINLVEGAHALAVLQQIEQHFGKKITLLNAANVDEIERLAAD